MDIEEYKKFAKNKIEADALIQQVRDVIKITKWKKQDMREGFIDLFQPLIEVQDAIKKILAINEGKYNFYVKKEDEDKDKDKDKDKEEDEDEDEDKDKEEDEDKDEDEDEEDEDEEEEDEDEDEDEDYRDINSKKYKEFIKKYIDRNLLDDNARIALTHNKIYKLPSEYIEDDYINIETLFLEVYDRIEYYTTKIKNYVNFFGQNGYYLARPKDKSINKKILKDISNHNILRVYLSNLKDLLQYKKKTGFLSND